MDEAYMGKSIETRLFFRGFKHFSWSWLDNFKKFWFESWDWIHLTVLMKNFDLFGVKIRIFGVRTYEKIFKKLNFDFLSFSLDKFQKN